MKVFILNPYAYDKRPTIMKVRERQPLDLGYIASLARNDGHSVCFLDAAVEGLNAQETIRRISEVEPDILMLTTTPMNRWECPMSYIDSVFRVIEGSSVPWKIVMGNHGTTQPEWIFKKAPSTNIVIRGEPELTAQNVIRAIAVGNAEDFAKKKLKEIIKDIKGVSYRKSDGSIKHNPPAERIRDLDALPMSAYDLMPMHLYRYSFDDLPAPFSIMMTTRGCPYNCTFCSKVMMEKEYIIRKPERVVEEMKHLRDIYGVRSIYFQDFEFVINKRYVNDLCDLMIHENLGMKWGCNTRANDFHFRDLFIKMKQAGCVRVNIGFESGSQQVLTAINKQIYVPMLENAIKTSRELGIKLGMYALLNAPGETRKTIRETMEFLKRNQVKAMNFNLAIPYFGTEMHRQLVAQIGPQKARGLSWDNIEQWAGRVNTELSPQEARKYQRKVKIEIFFGKLFFLNPKFYAYYLPIAWRVFKRKVKKIFHVDSRSFAERIGLRAVE